MEIKTLVELFDARPLENVLAVELFHPEQVVYICPRETPEVAEALLRTYFDYRGVQTALHFRQVDIYDTDEILALFREILTQYPDAVVDITGGTDAVLFAAGIACSEYGTPVITYSRTQNRFYSIQNAPSADSLPCDIRFTVEESFLMAGGLMRKGRVDNDILSGYLDDFDPFFAVYLKYRTHWDRIVTFMQRISPAAEDGSYSLEVSGGYTVKGDRGSRIPAPEDALRDFGRIGMIRDLEIVPEESVSFRFRDAQTRTWLRDVGSVLELYVYKACLDSGLFNDVRTSAVVDWSADGQSSTVSNELDVMCTRGITPVFISCKTCMVRTEALNELAILRDRFGGEIARAAIVTAEPAGSAARNRAAELNIRVIDLHDLESGEIRQCLESLLR